MPEPIRPINKLGEAAIREWGIGDEAAFHERAIATIVDHGVVEVGRRGHGALVLVDELGPQQRVAQEVHRGDLDQLGTEVHRDRQEADHAHVVEAGQPADHHVAVHVVLGADEHRLGVGVDVAVGDDHCLGRSGRPRRQLHQRDVVPAVELAADLALDADEIEPDLAVQGDGAGARRVDRDCAPLRHAQWYNQHH